MKLKSTLPKGDADGLTPLEGRLDAEGAPQQVVVLAILDVIARTESLVTHERELTLRLRRIEALLPGDSEHARRMLQRAFEQRTGVTTLPIDLEEDLRSAFAHAGEDDPDAGAFGSAFTEALRDEARKQGWTVHEDGSIEIPADTLRVNRDTGEVLDDDPDTPEPPAGGKGPEK